MDGFAFDQHRDVFLDAAIRVSAFGVGSGEGSRSDSYIKSFEEAFAFILRQSGTEIVRHLRRALRRIGGVQRRPSGRVRSRSIPQAACVSTRQAEAPARGFSRHLLAIDAA